jgi:hypothetical protein
MNKRDFIKSSILAGTGLLASKTLLADSEKKIKNQVSPKHWVWENPNNNEDDETLKKNTVVFMNQEFAGCFLKATVSAITAQQKRPVWKHTAGCGP